VEVASAGTYVNHLRLAPTITSFFRCQILFHMLCLQCFEAVG